jgi:hypothetical protein
MSPAGLGLDPGEDRRGNGGNGERTAAFGTSLLLYVIWANSRWMAAPVLDRNTTVLSA